MYSGTLEGNTFALIVIVCVFAAAIMGVYWWLFVYFWHNRKSWKTLSDLYHLYRGEDSIFYGLTVAGVAAFFQFCLCKLGRVMCLKLYDVSGIISNGYFLVLLSPFVLVYWCVVSVFVLLLSLVYVVFGTFGMLPIILSGLWALLFELPADVLNRKRSKSSGEQVDD